MQQPGILQPAEPDSYASTLRFVFLCLLAEEGLLLRTRVVMSAATGAPSPDSWDARLLEARVHTPRRFTRPKGGPWQAFARVDTSNAGQGHRAQGHGTRRRHVRDYRGHEFLMRQLREVVCDTGAPAAPAPVHTPVPTPPQVPQTGETAPHSFSIGPGGGWRSWSEAGTLGRVLPTPPPLATPAVWPRAGPPPPTDEAAVSRNNALWRPRRLGSARARAAGPAKSEGVGQEALAEESVIEWDVGAAGGRGPRWGVEGEGSSGSSQRRRRGTTSGGAATSSSPLSQPSPGYMGSTLRQPSRSRRAPRPCTPRGTVMALWARRELDTATVSTLHLRTMPLSLR
jgi:hypothetical protein